jgi:toxin YhaV
VVAERRSSSPRGRRDVSDTPPLVCNGWRIFVWGEFRRTWTKLGREVQELARQHPDSYKQHPKTIFLRDVRNIILSDVPNEPGAERFQQGNKLGRQYRHWRRAKFRGRFRLFFRYSSPEKVIIYVWLNDEKTLRKEGDRTDAYYVFRSMLERQRPPTDWEALVAECEPLPQTEIEA